MNTTQETRCGAIAASCRCEIDRDVCDGIHECKCGGSWSGEWMQPSFCIYSLPEFYVGPEGDKQ